jgi:hypothetical protein
VHRCYAEAVTLMPSCSGWGNVVVASESELWSLYKNTFKMEEQQLDTSFVERRRCAIEFCARLGKSGSETLQLIHQAYGDDAMRRAAVFKWWMRFRSNF